MLPEAPGVMLDDDAPGVRIYQLTPQGHQRWTEVDDSFSSITVD